MFPLVSFLYLMTLINEKIRKYSPTVLSLEVYMTESIAHKILSNEDLFFRYFERHLQGRHQVARHCLLPLQALRLRGFRPAPRVRPSHPPGDECSRTIGLHQPRKHPLNKSKKTRSKEGEEFIRICSMYKICKGLKLFALCAF